MLGLLTTLLAQGDPFGLGVARRVGLPADQPLEEQILRIANVALLLVGVLALAFLVYGGFRYVTSRGDSEEVEAAKRIIIYAVIGLVVIGVAAAVVQFVIQGVLGAQ